MKVSMKKNHVLLCSQQYFMVVNIIHHEMWDEIIYPLPKFNDAAVEIWKWISNFIPHLTHCGLVTPYGDREPGQHWLK